ncbi:class I SAM-dependent methyltransferase [Streptomyces albipurpureus]|uniref:Class I SAM-dependent methyltransferase n=1 Tax=Streptomyces albipurpureus TaxID=2897419 RepID=A0ABT0UJC6_9ACTN|nr:class I SAM-dependent methyltransferase [Streptomyces sp. CWNU-1]MCM2388352.1 class I SAM-dependent methyltransferase [Streptomyces sp. CWNU-1]
MDTGFDSAAWSYGPLASLVYEVDKPVGTSFGDVEFYTDRLRDVSGPILEPAVGTGRMMIPLLEQGLTVRGYDTSASMLEQCRANCAERGLTADVFEADMVTHRDPGAYAAIVIPTGSFALLPDRASAMTALYALHDSLAPGGRLIVDIEPPSFATDTGTDPVRHWWRGERLLTLTTWRKEADPVSQRATRWLRYESWKDGVLERTELQVFSLLWFGLAEFTALLERAGFIDIVVHGGYRPGAAPLASDDVWTFEATRR